MQTLTLIQPDDWHCHLRDGPVLIRTVTDTARYCHRAIIMPNLVPPITTVKTAEAYRQRILQHVAQGVTFTPLMTLYLTDTMSISTLQEAKNSGFIYAAKLYPAGATTHSDAGVTNIENIYPLFEKLQTLQMPLLIHGEVTDPAFDIFDREAIFIEKILINIRKQFPELKIVLEHVTTKVGVDFVKAHQNTAATITPVHLLYNRNDLLVGGIKPHRYCLPILKTCKDQAAIIKAATSGSEKFFLGTDSAPHAKHTKECASGCAGVYSAPVAIEVYASIFEKYQALDQLEAFAAINGAKFYGLDINERTITLQRNSWQVSNQLPYGNEKIVPLLAGETLNWKIASKG